MSNLSPDFTLPINFCANPQDAWTIPARFYTDSQAFEHEKERIFANSWICVAHGSEVARPNDYITREIIGENIVIVRGRDNILRAFYNVCPHRGHQLLARGHAAPQHFVRQRCQVGDLIVLGFAMGHPQ